VLEPPKLEPRGVICQEDPNRYMCPIPDRKRDRKAEAADPDYGDEVGTAAAPGSVPGTATMILDAAAEGEEAASTDVRGVAPTVHGRPAAGVSLRSQRVRQHAAACGAVLP